MANSKIGHADIPVVYQGLLRYDLTYIKPAVVKDVNPITGKIKVSFTDGNFDDPLLEIPFKYDVNLFGSVDVSVPRVGDHIWVFSDGSNRGIHIGGTPTFYSEMFQDRFVRRNSKPNETLLLPALYPGDRLIKSASGGLIKLTDSVLLEDGLGNELCLNSFEDRLETFTGGIHHELYKSEIRMGLTKRYNPNKNKVRDYVVKKTPTSSPSSEFSIFLGKTLKKTITGVSSYLRGGDDDTDYDKFDFDIGLENTPKVQFQISDSEVVDINGISLPTLQGKPLNFLFDIGSYFSFRVSNDGSTLLGNAGSGGINGLYINNNPGTPYVRLGTSFGSQVVFYPNSTASVENPSGYVRIFGDGSISLSAGSGVLVNLDPKSGNEKFEVILNGSKQMVFTADQNGVSVNAGGTVLKFGGGEMQLNGMVNLGQPNLTSLSPYEPSILGKTASEMLAELSNIVYLISQQLLLPLVGLASYPPTVPTVMTQIQTKLAAFSAKYGVIPVSGTLTPAPNLLSKQVTVAP
ncbi:MAG: hypothetical protein ABIK31_01650 [candidate division WOR-3 bacterium]